MIVTLIVFLVIGLQMAHLSQVSGNNENGFLNPFDLSQWSEEILHRQYHHHHHHHHGNRARRTLETEKIYRCGRKLYTDVLSACNGPCEPGKYRLFLKSKSINIFRYGTGSL